MPPRPFMAWNYCCPPKESLMSKIGFSIVTVSSGLVIFTVLCNASVSLPTAFLILFLFVLHLALIWMVLTVLKHGKPSRKTFDEQYYEDQDF